MTRAKPRILACAEHYLPGFRAGGPIRSISNLAEHLGGEYDFRVLTSDHDWNEDEPYEGIEYGTWMDIGPAPVRYLSPVEDNFPAVARLLASLEFDLLYINSLYGLRFSLPAVVLQSLGLLGDTPVVFAPRGQLAPSAIESGSPLKWPFLQIMSRSGLYDRVFWHATKEEEARRIRQWFGEDVPLEIAPNLGTVPPKSLPERPPKDPGTLDLVFLSRLHPIKNLPYALEAVSQVDGDVTFHIYGPVDDEEYFETCKQAMEATPEHVEVHFHGPVRPTEVIPTIAAHDLFILPTQGENFGHVIFEAMAGSTPVLISDQTPWRGLEDEGIGWDLPLADPSAFAEKLQWAVDASGDQLEEMGQRARAFAEEESGLEASLQQTRELFEAALSM